MSKASLSGQRSTCPTPAHAFLRARRTCTAAEAEVWPGPSTRTGTCLYSPDRPTTCRRATSPHSPGSNPSCPAAQ
eukprot:2579051-Rhodomonas_salina.1